MNLPIIGTSGVLLLAKKMKLIDKIAPQLFELKQSGYYLSEALTTLILFEARALK